MLPELSHYFGEYNVIISDWYDSQNYENSSQIELKTFQAPYSVSTQTTESTVLTDV